MIVMMKYIIIISLENNVDNFSSRFFKDISRPVLPDLVHILMCIQQVSMYILQYSSTSQYTISKFDLVNLYLLPACLPSLTYLSLGVMLEPYVRHGL